MRQLRYVIILIALVPQYLFGQTAGGNSFGQSPQPHVDPPAGLIYVVPMAVLPPAQQVVAPIDPVEITAPTGTVAPTGQSLSGENASPNAAVTTTDVATAPASAAGPVATVAPARVAAPSATVLVPNVTNAPTEVAAPVGTVAPPVAPGQLVAPSVTAGSTGPAGGVAPAGPVPPSGAVVAPQGIIAPAGVAAPAATVMPIAPVQIVAPMETETALLEPPGTATQQSQVQALPDVSQPTTTTTPTPSFNLPAVFGQCPPPANGKPSPCAKSHKPLFYENNFSYLNDPEYTGCCLGDCFKQVGQDCGPKLDFGGQFRWRFHSERGMAQQAGARRFQATDNEFLLFRTRLYANLELHDKVRLFAEGIYADVAGANAEYVSRGIDENWGDFLNLFADIRLTDDTTVRIGRQELLFGAQRLVSPLDWANTRRTFEGIRVLHKHDNIALDGFYTNFVPVVDNEIDEANYDISLYGVYSSMKEEKDTFDLYYLGFDNQTTNFSIHTIGSRLFGGRGDIVYDLEGGAQFGRQSGLGLEHESAFATIGVGRKFKHKWKPVLWFYWDYAAGNNTGGDFNRFNQIFPWAHKYLGFVDAVQRSNVESPNVLLVMKPTKKFKLLCWYYHFMSNQDTDIVPAIGGTPNQSTTSKDLGDELDFMGVWSLSPRTKLVAGYSRFWIGNKILETTDADFAYVQYHVNF